LETIRAIGRVVGYPLRDELGIRRPGDLAMSVVGVERVQNIQNWSAKRTLDSFLRGLAIDKVALLKVDAEGHDLEVLKGTSTFLTEGRITAVLVETGLNAPGVNQPPLEELQAYLLSKNYYLWAICNPCRGPALSRKMGKPMPEVLTYCDAIFIQADAQLRRMAIL
jgi:hypothetical protein